jgi:hypothetical protein
VVSLADFVAHFVPGFTHLVAGLVPGLADLLPRLIDRLLRLGEGLLRLLAGLGRELVPGVAVMRTPWLMPTRRRRSRPHPPDLRRPHGPEHQDRQDDQNEETSHLS